MGKTSPFKKSSNEYFFLRRQEKKNKKNLVHGTTYHDGSLKIYRLKQAAQIQKKTLKKANLTNIVLKLEQYVQLINTFLLKY